MTDTSEQSIKDSASAQPWTPARRLALVIGVLLACLAIYWLWTIQAGLDRGQRALERGDLTKARSYLTHYLAWHPRDAAAHMLMAEALVKDDDGAGPDFVQRAIQHLDQIDDNSELASKARLQQARLTLLIQKQPARAERLLQRALQLDPDSLDACVLMWKLLDLTGRHVISREYFWRAYELSSESARCFVLRDWFLAEFYPEVANASFYEAIGARAIGKIPASISLLVQFREDEPEAPFLHAALGLFYLEGGTPKAALELLKESPDLTQAMQDRFFVSVLFESLVDLGEIDKARTCFEQFPEPHTDYLYWRAAGMFHHHVTEDAAAAVTAYEEALTKWPGKFDWGMMMKLAECLRKVGRNDDASTLQERVKQLTTTVLTKENSSRLRDRLRDLKDPAVAGELSDIYNDFGLIQEAEAWKNYQQKLLTSPPDLPSSTSAR